MNPLKTIFFWPYRRGSWQWDLFCLLFIVIIFATPADFLMNYTKRPLPPESIRALLFESVSRR